MIRLHAKNILKLLDKNLFLLLIVIIIGLYLRVSVSDIGYNFDMESWKIVSNRDPFTQSVYSFTHRYNYGPIWSYIISIINFFSNSESIQELHLLLTIFMAVVDIFIFFIISKLFGFLAGSIFFLNPIQILISGYHIQIDNLAILFGLIFWIIINKAIDQNSKKVLSFKLVIISLVILGISISIKHILIFLPVVLFLYFSRLDIKLTINSLKKISYNLIFLFIPYFTFILIFIMELVFHYKNLAEVWNGIILNVFKYKSFSGNSISFYLIRFIDYYLNFNIEIFFTNNSLIFYMLFIVFLLYFNFYKIEFKKLFFLYLLAFYSFSPAIADQYFTILIISFSAFGLSFIPLLSTITGGIYLIFGSGSNLYSSYQLFGIDPTLYSYWYIYPQILSSLFLIFYLYFSNIFLNNIKTYLYIYQILLKNLYFIFYITFFIIILNYVDYHKSSLIWILNVTTSENCTKEKLIKKEIYKVCNGKNRCTLNIKDNQKLRECYKDIKIKFNCERLPFDTEFILDSKIYNNSKDLFVFDCNTFL